MLINDKSGNISRLILLQIKENFLLFKEDFSIFKDKINYNLSFTYVIISIIKKYPLKKLLI